MCLFIHNVDRGISVRFSVKSKKILLSEGLCVVGIPGVMQTGVSKQKPHHNVTQLNQLWRISFSHLSTHMVSSVLVPPPMGIPLTVVKENLRVVSPTIA